MTTGLSSVLRRKCFISLGSCQGSALPRPITRFRVMAQISEMRMGLPIKLLWGRLSPGGTGSSEYENPSTEIQTGLARLD